MHAQRIQAWAFLHRPLRRGFCVLPLSLLLSQSVHPNISWAIRQGHGYKTLDVASLEGFLPVCFTQCLRFPSQVGSVGRNPEVSGQQLLASLRLDIRAALMYFSVSSLFFLLPHVTPHIPPPPQVTYPLPVSPTSSTSNILVAAAWLKQSQWLLEGGTSSEDCRSS